MKYGSNFVTDISFCHSFLDAVLYGVIILGNIRGMFLGRGLVGTPGRDNVAVEIGGSVYGCPVI